MKDYIEREWFLKETEYSLGGLCAICQLGEDECAYDGECGLM